MSQILGVVAVIVLGLAALGTAFVFGWRVRSPLVLRPIIAFSKRFMNPRQMQTAGAPGAYAGIIRHRGRRSGTEYETPVGIVADGDAFLVALPYGDRTQWLRNVLAAGTATIVHEGSVHRVDRAELVPIASVDDRFSATDRRLFRWLRVDQCLSLRRNDATATVGRAA